MGRFLISFLCLLGMVASASAQGELARPQGPVILTVSGAIGVTNAPDKAEFDREMLLELGQETLRTTTPWTDGVITFEGVPVARVLDKVGASGSQVRAVAVNDYAVELELAELRRYPVILAMSQDGKPLTLRDRGPLWIVYPRDDHPELMDAINNSKWIWQLRELEIR